MRIKLSIYCFALCALGPGCQLAVLTTRTMTASVTRCANDLWEGLRNHSLANAAWDQYLAAHTGHTYSVDFAEGFKCGFEDYIFAGGNGNPPPLPAHRYWCYHFETPDGYHQIQDWFAGFREGAAVAEKSGYRSLTIVPIALPQPPPAVPPAPPAPPPQPTGTLKDGGRLEETPLALPRKMDTSATVPSPDLKLHPLPVPAQPPLPPAVLATDLAPLNEPRPTDPHIQQQPTAALPPSPVVQSQAPQHLPEPAPATRPPTDSNRRPVPVQSGPPPVEPAKPIATLRDRERLEDAPLPLPHKDEHCEALLPRASVPGANVQPAPVRLSPQPPVPLQEATPLKDGERLEDSPLPVPRKEQRREPVSPPASTSKAGPAPRPQPLETPVAMKDATPLGDPGPAAQGARELAKPVLPSRATHGPVPRPMVEPAHFLPSATVAALKDSQPLGEPGSAALKTTTAAHPVAVPARDPAGTEAQYPEPAVKDATPLD